MVGCCLTGAFGVGAGAGLGFDSRMTFKRCSSCSALVNFLANIRIDGLGLETLGVDDVLGVLAASEILDFGDDVLGVALTSTSSLLDGVAEVEVEGVVEGVAIDGVALAAFLGTSKRYSHLLGISGSVTLKVLRTSSLTFQHRSCLW